MSTAVHPLVVILLVAGALLLGLLWGRTRERRRAADANSQAFAAGFRAGHLQGWRDAQAAREPMAATVPPATVAPAAGAVPPPAAPVPPAAPPLAPPGWPTRQSQPVGAFQYRPTAPVRPAARDQGRPPPVHRPAPYQVADRPPVPEESAADRAARKEKRDRQNINITLYVASLLLVAAGALFIGTGLPAVLRFAGVVAITALFYTGGLVLHAKAPRLRPAAVAFAGTGLALIPVVGLAMYNFTLPDGPAAWLVTSFIGTVAYVAAAVRMDSRVLAYLSLTFVVSTAWSGISVVGGALLWYFAALIAIAVILTLLALTRPRWMPSVFLKPLMDLHPFMVPGVAAAATFLPMLLGRGEYAFIMFLCGTYFALMAALPQSRFRVGQYYGARVSLTAAAAAAVWAASDSLPWMALTAIMLAAVQSVLLASGLTVGPGTLLGSAGRRRADALGTFGAQLLLTLLWGAATLFVAAVGPAVGPGVGVPVWLPLLLALCTGMALAVSLGGLAEGAPVAALLVAAAFGGRAGVWSPAVFLLLVALFWAVRSLPPAEPLRRHFVLAARIAATLAVPAVAAAATGGGAVPVLSAFLLALVLQQLATAALVRAGVPSLAPDVSLAAFSLAALLVLAALALADDSTGRTLAGAAVVLQLLTSLGLGRALSGEAAAGTPRRSGVRELLPLGMAAGLAGLAFAGVSLGIGNISLALTVLYLVATALRRASLQQRWCYWWMARGTGTVLVLTGFQQLRRETGPLLIGGEELMGASLAVLVLGLQLAFPLLAELRRRAPGGVVADAAAVLVLQAAALAVLTASGLQAQPAGGWQLTAAVVVMALGAAAAGLVLRARPRAAVFAPAVLAVLLAARAGSALDAELVLGIFAAFSAAMVVASASRTAKGVYFAAARVLTLALALVLSYDATVSVTAVSVTFGLVLAAQHVIRSLMRHRLLEVPFQQAAVWITLAAQTALPLGYLAAAPDDGGRWVIVLHVALLLVSAAVASRVFAARGAAYLTVYAAVVGTVALGPLAPFDGGIPAGGLLDRPALSHDGVVVVLLVLSLAATAAGLRFRRNARADVERWLWLAASGAFVLTALVLVPLAAVWLAGASVLVLAAVCFAASHLERWPALYVPAVAAALSGATLSGAALPASVLLEAVPGAWGSYLPWLAGCAAAVSLYAVRWLRRGPLAADPVRRWSLVSAAVLGLGLAAAAGLWWEATAWTGAALVAATAAVCCAEAPARARRAGAELGLFATTAAVQRAALFAGLEARSEWPDAFWTLQWYVVLAGLLGALRLASWNRGAGHRRTGRALLSGAAGLLTLSGLGIILGGGPGQQLWVLALLAVLLMGGLAFGERLFVWWGAAGVALCIMWAMRQYTFALLALIAAALIVLAVWRLNRSKPVVDEPAPQREPADHS
ncbi:hypothetical protein [Arthrobacter sp. AL12]|uniref:hypothetical protein n=1 Tax=Arthrobacter sp. AL12 TaxID=3042241 RepID=UPI00249A7FD2|nr:hypothetical protein [Arthrobacter sp. AL12]MDI3211454.1 hypothetical protein [Arthrobacter sp. AL12]